jgi:hypothetical protein
MTNSTSDNKRTWNAPTVTSWGPASEALAKNSGNKADGVTKS